MAEAASPLDERSRGDGYERVARLDEVPEGTLRGVVKSDGTRVCLVHEEGQIYAVSDTCTHAEFPMHEGEARSCTIECIWHGAQFDLRTGGVIRGPADEPLPVFEVKVDGGWILVRGGMAP